jgi:hypothetical protein
MRFLLRTLETPPATLDASQLPRRPSRDGASTMHALSVPTRPSRPRAPTAGQLAVQPALFLVTIDVTVPGTSSAAGRRALHAALGEGSRLIVIAADKRNDSITFRVDAIARSTSDVVGALAFALRRATIGRVRAVVAGWPAPHH